MITPAVVSEGKKEACKTYLEQTKLLVTLASAFLFAPPSLVAILKDSLAVKLSSGVLTWFVVAESLFVASVLFGYVVLGSLSGSQDREDFDIYRPATRLASLGQFLLYLAGIVVFVVLASKLVK